MVSTGRLDHVETRADNYAAALTRLLGTESWQVVRAVSSCTLGLIATPELQHLPSPPIVPRWMVTDCTWRKMECGISCNALKLDQIVHSGVTVAVVATRWTFDLGSCSLHEVYLHLGLHTSSNL